jgi:hypothetical protein
LFLFNNVRLVVQVPKRCGVDPLVRDFQRQYFQSSKRFKDNGLDMGLYLCIFWWASPGTNAGALWSCPPERANILFQEAAVFLALSIERFQSFGPLRFTVRENGNCPVALKVDDGVLQSVLWVEGVPASNKESQQMARANREGINKSAAIREILAKGLNTPTKDVMAALEQRGIKVHPNLVYLMKSKMKARRRKQKRQQAVENGRELGISNPVDLILEVRRLSEKAGGMRHLKKLVDVLAE